jgi:hypothetical protein
MFGKAPAPPNKLWSCHSTNLQLHRRAGHSIGVEEMCLAEITTPDLKTEIMLRKVNFTHYKWTHMSSSFFLFFLSLLYLFLALVVVHELLPLLRSTCRSTTPGGEQASTKVR